MESATIPRSLTRPRPREHFVQLYDDAARLLRSLEWFVLTGLEDDGAVVVIATDVHLRELECRLGHRGVELARRNGRYIALRAEDVLASFMVEGWPNAPRFDAAISGVLERARASGARRVRAYGEMVAILMARSNPEATLRLEQLWTALVEREGVALFCAYPRAVFGDDGATLRMVCETHTHVLPS